jgi:Mannosyltransferase putative
LPIEVWHLGPEEMGPPMRGLLEELGAQPVDAFEVAKRHQVERLGGWELKPYALMHSRFREVLLLDADNIPLRDPEFLFDRSEFRDTGALFWPDIVRLSPDNAIWAVSGLTYRDTPSFESGQIVLDKSRCWQALSLAHWLNQHSDTFYNFLHGDKDTFLIAWLMLAQPYYLIRHRPKLLEATMCQRDPDGVILFQHRNNAKWILHGDNPRIEGFRLERECRTLLEELATLWDGRVFNPPSRSDEARQLEADLIDNRQFCFVRVSSDERRVELLPDHRIRPAGRHEQYWHVADGPDGPELRIEANGLRGCALQRSKDGTWRGRSLQAPGMPIELVPVGAGGPAAPRRQGSDGTALMSVLDRILDAGTALPSDREVMRDLVGALRMLAAIDPAVLERLRDENGRFMPGSVRAQALQAALAELVDARSLADGAGIMPGHNWPSPPFKLGQGYER